MENSEYRNIFQFKGFTAAIKGDIMFTLLPFLGENAFETEKNIKETIKLKQKNVRQVGS
jgi:hypothetical protein